MSEVSLLDDVRQAAREYESSQHRLRLAVTAAVTAQVPIASIAKAAGVTRQTVYNWGVSYGQGHGLTVAAGTHLASLPVQRPRAVKGAPVLILGVRRKGRLGRAPDSPVRLLPLIASRAAIRVREASA